MSGLVISGFDKVVLKSVKVIEKEGKKPLVFVNLVDFNSFDDTGDMIFLKQDLSVNDIATLKSLEKKQVRAVLTINEFNGKKSYVVTDVKAAS